MDYLSIAEEKGITLLDAVAGGRGGVEYILENYKRAIAQYAPQMTDRLGAPATEQKIEALENRLGFALSEEFKQLHRTFDGQTGAPFYSAGQRFVSLDEIEAYQDEMEQYLEAHYGKNWQKVRIPEDEFVEEGYIKNRLYSRKWVPFYGSRIRRRGCPQLFVF